MYIVSHLHLISSIWFIIHLVVLAKVFLHWCCDACFTANISEKSILDNRFPTAKERRSMELNSKLVELCSLIIAEKLRNNGVFNGGEQISDGRRNSDFIVGVLIIVNNPLFHLPNFDYTRNSRSDNPSYHLLNPSYFRLLLHLHRPTSRRCILRSRNWPRFIPRFFRSDFG